MRTELLKGPTSDRLEEAKKRAKCLSGIMTAVGNFSVQYNFQSISIALLIMSQNVCTANDDACMEGTQAKWVSSVATSTVFAGAIAGQLMMGYIGDVFGRSIAMLITLLMVFFSSLASALLPFGPAEQIYGTIIVCRFFLGIGVGGIYPLAATKAAEDGCASEDSESTPLMGNEGKYEVSNVMHDDEHGHEERDMSVSVSGGGGGKGQAVNSAAASWSFFWQVPGSMTPWLIGFIFTYTSVSSDMRWRLLLGLGSIPSGLVVICSILELRAMAVIKEETTSLKNSQNSHIDQRQASLEPTTTGTETETETIGPIDTGPIIWAMLQEAETWRKLLITGGAWFIYDVAYYGVNLFGGEILHAISDEDDDSVSSDESIRNVAYKELIAQSMGLPAVILSIYILIKWGPKFLQTVGFALITVLFSMMAITIVPLKSSQPKALFAIYCFLLFSLSFGPNLTTYILPAMIFPKQVRTTFNGFAAASGKLGAFAGVYLYGAIAEASSYSVVMIVSAAVSLVGCIISYVFIRSKDLNARDRTDSEFFRVRTSE